MVVVFYTLIEVKINMDCIVCQINKKDKYFPKQSKCASSNKNKCKKCLAIHRVDQNPDDQKPCTKCQNNKKLTEYYINDSGIESRCKSCLVAYINNRRRTLPKSQEKKMSQSTQINQLVDEVENLKKEMEKLKLTQIVVNEVSATS
jgi:hypothetical protein